MPRKTALRLVEPTEQHTPPLAQLAVGLRLIADALERLEGEKLDQLLTGAQCLARYGLGRNALQARAVPRVKCGRAYRWRVSDIEASLVSIPARPRATKPPKCDDQLERMIAAGRVRT